MPTEPPAFPYELCVRTVFVGTERFDLLALRDFEDTVSRLAEHVGAGGSARWFEDWCPMFGVVWPSAHALAAQVSRGVRPGSTVLELGCGLALPSMVAARRGARAVATDQHPHTARFLNENLERNQVAVRFAPFDWAGEVPSDLPERFDHVVASDVLYTGDQPEVVARAFARFLAPGGTGWLTDPGRPWLQEFADAARAQGLAVEVDVVGDDGGVFLLTLSAARPPGSPSGPGR